MRPPSRSVDFVTGIGSSRRAAAVKGSIAQAERAFSKIDNRSQLNALVMPNTTMRWVDAEVYHPGDREGLHINRDIDGL